MSKLEKLNDLVKTGDRQYRNLVLEVREGETDDKIVEGYATTYDEPYYMFRERGKDGYTIEVREEISSHAFDNTDMSDVIMQYNHEGRVFARLSNGTLTLDKQDPKGLFIKADLGGTEIGRQLYEEIKGGYTNKMSFGFSIDKVSEMRQVESDNDANEIWVYTIEGIRKLYDVSAVSLPQNDYTSISARALNDGEINTLVTERLQAHEEMVARQAKIAELEKLLESED